MEYDIFISHASEDKISFVDPLFKILQNEDIRIWYDRFELKVGDSLREKIDYGLSRSRYGIIVLSHSFFNKEWPRSELDALISRQNTEGRKVILPIWYDVNIEDVSRFSPILASKLAINSSEGVYLVAQKIIDVVYDGQNQHHPEDILKVVERDFQYYLSKIDKSADKFSFLNKLAAIQIKKWHVAAEKDLPIGLFFLGMAYRYGLSQERDALKGFQLINSAAQKGIVPAIWELGLSYMHGLGVDIDYEKAFELILKAGEKKFIPAFHTLGQCYVNGFGVKVDKVEGTRWYKLGAEQENPLSQGMYGAMLASGEGIKQNDEEARIWLKKAFDNGNKNVEELLNIVNETDSVDEGYQFGNCLLCERPVHGDMEHGYLPFRQRCDGTYIKGSALFCPLCKSFIHNTCAKQSFWGKKKCPNCDNKLIKTGDGGISIF